MISPATAAAPVRWSIHLNAVDRSSGIPLADAQQRYAPSRSRNRFQRDEVPGDGPAFLSLPFFRREGIETRLLILSR